jgi:dTDP-4-amino-4,6-dideoxygalactose transaminase
MKTFVSKKSIDYEKLKKYLEPAHNTNQFSNWGWAVSELERRAREMLQIDDSKAIIATCSGAAALHAIIFAIQRNMIPIYGLLHKTLLFQQLLKDLQRDQL